MTNQLTEPEVVEPNEPDHIRDEVIRYMQTHQMSSYRLSCLSGVKYDTVRRYVSGSHQTTTQKASRLLAVFNHHGTQSR